MTVKEVKNQKTEKSKIRCKCGNKDRFEAVAKTMTVNCLDCGAIVAKSEDEPELYKKLWGKR